MPADIIWTPLAREDLIDIYYAIARDSPLAAERVFDRIEQRIARLALQPRSGVTRNDIRASLRMAVVSSYLVLYEVVSDQDAYPVDAIVIVRIVAGRRDLTKVFD